VNMSIYRYWQIYDITDRYRY